MSSTREVIVVVVSTPSESVVVVVVVSEIVSAFATRSVEKTSGLGEGEVAEGDGGDEGGGGAGFAVQ